VAELRTVLSNRRTRYTAAPAGLVLGLFGTLVGAAFTYLIKISDGSFYLDPHQTVTLFRDWSLLVLLLPVLHLIVVPLCGLSAARCVGPRLMSWPRLAWLVTFAVVTLAGVATTPAGLEQVHWLGSALVVIALALPHRPD
jgi:hypothetical protein